MAAAGGFWAKGTFFSSAETALLSMSSLGVTKDIAGYKSLFEGDEAKYAPEQMKQMINATLVALWNPSGYYQTKLVTFQGLVGEKKAQEAIKAAVEAEKAAKAAEDAQIAVTAQGVSFSKGEIAALAKANGLSTWEMEQKLKGYKTPTWVNKWKQAAVEGTNVLPKAQPKPKATETAAQLTPSGLEAYTGIVTGQDTVASGWQTSAQSLAAQYSGWGHSLPYEQLSAVKSYTGSYYSYLNGQMRSGNWDPSKFPNSQLTKTATNLNAAIDSAPPLAKNAVFFRGFGNYDIHTAVKNGTLTPGSQVIDPAFMSSSANAYKAAQFANKQYPVVYRIAAPAGTKGGAYVNPITSVSGEYEFLWQSGKPMTVIKAKMGSFHGIYAAIVDLVPTEAVAIATD